MAGLNLFPDQLFSGTAQNTAAAPVPEVPAVDPSAAIQAADLQDLADSAPIDPTSGDGLGIATPPQNNGSLVEGIGRALIGFSLGQRGGISALRGLNALNSGSGADGPGKAALSISRVMDASDNILEVADKLTGADRTKMLQKGAAQLNALMPGSGDALLSISAKPDKGALLRKHLPNSKIVKRSLAIDDTGAGVVKLLGTKEGQELLSKEAEVEAIPVINQKLLGFKTGLREFVPPEMLEEIERDGAITESEILEINNFARNHPDENMRKFALDDTELGVIQSNKENTLESAGILTGKNEQALLKDNAKSRFAPGTIVEIPGGKDGRSFKKAVRDPDSKLLPEFPHENGFAILGEGRKGNEFQNFPSTTFTGVLDDGRKVQVTQGKNGAIRISPIKPLVKGEKKSLIQEIQELKDAEKKETEEGKPDEGQPAIPTEIIEAHANNPKLKDTKLGKTTDEGVEVLDSDGEIVGHLRIPSKE